MKALVQVFLCSLFCYVMLVQQAKLIAAQEATSDTKTAVVSVVASEKGLPVLINGSPVGVTPLRNFVVPEGEHEIIVRHAQPESWLDIDWVEKYQLVAGDSLLVRPQLRRGYLINSIPYGAEVFIDHVYQGTTPVVVRVAEDRGVGVELRLNGYQDFFTTLDSNAQRLWNVTLLEDAEHAALRQHGLMEKKARRNHFRTLTLLTAGASALSGVTAILLKQRADNFYSDYLSSGDPKEMNSLYNKATEYDEYAGIAFAVFEVSFGLSFYWFLRSTTD